MLQTIGRRFTEIMDNPYSWDGPWLDYTDEGFPVDVYGFDTAEGDYYEVNFAHALEIEHIKKSGFLHDIWEEKYAVDYFVTLRQETEQYIDAYIDANELTLPAEAKDAMISDEFEKKKGRFLKKDWPYWMNANADMVFLTFGIPEGGDRFARRNDPHIDSTRILSTVVDVTKTWASKNRSVDYLAYEADKNDRDEGRKQGGRERLYRVLTQKLIKDGYFSEFEEFDRSHYRVFGLRR